VFEGRKNWRKGAKGKKRGKGWRKGLRGRFSGKIRETPRPPDPTRTSFAQN